jgi:mannonate dehydratase
VVESIPVHNSIKLRTGPYGQYIGWWKDSLAALATAGVKVVCYNFMPLVDWTRTDLRFLLPSTGFALRFDILDFAVYDLFMLARLDADKDYTAQQKAAAQARFEAMSEFQRSQLEQTVVAGLPGAEAIHDRDAMRRLLAEYSGLTPQDLRANLLEFLREVVPVAEENGIRLAIHADDPPWPLFGLPRVVSTASDARAILAGCDAPANGLTFCVGSYGARGDNDLPAMVDEFAARIHFVHLRQVRREADRVFHEAEHLGGSSDMVGIIHRLLREEIRRRGEGRSDHEIPMRPDHGHLLADDVGKNCYPGYSLVGRLKGLAELRGVVHGLKYAVPELEG